MLKQKFIQPDRVLMDAGLKPGMTVVDLGVGNGFFALAASKIVGEQGRVLGVDILEESLGQVMSQARIEHLKNIRTMRLNLDKIGSSDLPDLSFNFVILGKILTQLKNPESLIRDVYRILKTGGLVVAIEWKNSIAHFGPPSDQKIDEQKMEQLFSRPGFKLVKTLETDKYHYSMVFQK